MLTLTDHERAFKRKLIKGTKSIRKKTRTFRSGVSADVEVFQKIFKPIIEYQHQLTEVVNVVKQQKAQLPKQEAVESRLKKKHY